MTVCWSTRWNSISRRGSSRASDWVELDPQFIHQTFGMTNRGIFRLLLGDSMSEAEIANYSALKEECYRDVARGKITLMAGVREVLDALAQRVSGWRSGPAGPGPTSS